MRVDQPLHGNSSSRYRSCKNDEPSRSVIIVDDDAAVREALSELTPVGGLPSRSAFASTREIARGRHVGRPGCLILDVRMPGASGLDLQHHLARGGNPKPIIFLTGHGDIPMTVQAMKAGAVDFLTKPVRDQTLLDAVIAAALQRDAAQTARRSNSRRRIVERLETLTPREREVLREGRAWPPQQADRLRPRHQRSHGQAASRQRHAKDAGNFPRRADPHRKSRCPGLFAKGSAALWRRADPAYRNPR